VFLERRHSRYDCFSRFQWKVCYPIRVISLYISGPTVHACKTGNKIFKQVFSCEGVYMKIYAGNLAYDVTKEELQKEFEAFGKVESVSMITDRDTGKSKGFAFIEMPVLSEGQAAVAGLNGKSIKERALVVNPARARTEDRGGGYGGRGGSGGGYGGNRRGGGGGGGYDRNKRGGRY
jgi:RNA recognition motif-containing protein